VAGISSCNQPHLVTINLPKIWLAEGLGRALA
jgi:hypothetical protein